MRARAQARALTVMQSSENTALVRFMMVPIW
jgi:hypothetical protein